jgi:hypothetical protein
LLFDYKVDTATALRCYALADRQSVFFCSPFAELTSSFLIEAHRLDYTLVEVSAAELLMKPLVLWPASIDRDRWKLASACVVGHPGGAARTSQLGAIKALPGNQLTCTHLAITEGGSSGSPVFHHTKDFSLLGLHYWGDKSSGSFICLDAIVVDLIKLEIICRAGDGFDPSDPAHVDDVAYFSACLAGKSTQAKAFELLDELVPSGIETRLLDTTFDLSRGFMKLQGQQAHYDRMIELSSFSILPESHPWTIEDQQSFDGQNSSHGETKIGVIVYSLVDGKRQGEVIIVDLSKISQSLLCSGINTSHARAFKHVVGRDPRQGLFVYNTT